jgi:hypothetical protein
MIEMRWLTWEEEENIVPPTHQIQFGKPFDKHMVTKRRLQYRQKVDTTIRAGSAGTWDTDSLARTANMQWSEWRDVPEVVDRDLNCP